MKRPFETITDTFLENLDKLKENQRYNFNYVDRFMIWIIGFSIGGLSIIVINLAQFNSSFSHFILKIILILLSTSIILGIIYRWAFYLFQIQYQNIEFYLQSAFSNKEIMEINPDDLTNEADIEEVIRRLKIDFDEDLSFLLGVYAKENNAGKLVLLNDLKSHFIKVGKSVKDEYEFAMDYVKNTYKESFGLSDKRIDKLFNSNTASKLKLLGWIAAIAFFISCLSFISVIIILCINF